MDSNFETFNTKIIKDIGFLKMTKLLKEWGADTLGPLNSPMEDEYAKKQEELLETGEYTPVTLSNPTSFESLIKRERSDISIISDETLDKEGDIVIQKNIDFDSLGFRKNPVVSYNHNYDIPPVGKSLWQKTRAGVTKAKTQYISRPESLPKNVEWFPDSIFHMIEAGVMRGKSIGGLAKYRAPTQDDFDKNPSWQGAKRIVEKYLVYEYCVCSIGMNANAIVEMVSKSLITIPDDILERDFGEIAEKIKAIHKSIKIKNELPLIKSVITLKEIKEERKQAIEKIISQCIKQTPDLINDTIKRAMGRVE